MKQQGFSLLEFLISLAICSSALIAILSTQTQALRHSMDAFTYHRAELHSLDFLERLRANPSAKEQYLAYHDNVNTDISCEAQPCTANELALFDLQQWQNSWRNHSPQLVDSKLCLQAIEYGISLRWAWYEVSAQRHYPLNCRQANLQKDLFLLE